MKLHRAIKKIMWALVKGKKVHQETLRPGRYEFLH